MNSLVVDDKQLAVNAVVRIVIDPGSRGNVRRRAYGGCRAGVCAHACR